MQKGRDAFKSFLTILLQGGTMHTATKVKPASVMKPYVMPAAVFALVCLVSTAAAFQRGSDVLFGATIKELVVAVDQRGPVIVLRTNESTGNGCSTFTLYDDQPSFNAFLAILLSAKMANRPIIVAHGSGGPNAPCLLTMVGPE